MYWSGNTANFTEKETSILQNRFKDSHEALSVFLQSFFLFVFRCHNTAVFQSSTWRVTSQSEEGYY